MIPEDDKRQSMARYMTVIQDLLAQPKTTECLIRETARIDWEPLIRDLQEAFGIFTTASMGRYEELTEADRIWLRDLGIEP